MDIITWSACVTFERMCHNHTGRQTCRAPHELSLPTFTYGWWFQVLDAHTADGQLQSPTAMAGTVLHYLQQSGYLESPPDDGSLSRELS